MENMINIKLNNIEELKNYGFDILDKENVLINNIKEILNEKGLNQSDLAKLTGISRQNISDIIQNKLKPGIDFAIKIAKVLGVTVEDLFELDESAWFKIAKLEDDTSIFIDIKELKIIDNKQRKEQILKDGLEYYLLNEKKGIDEKSYKELLNKFIKENKESKKTKKELIKEFEDTICSKRYKKLVQRIKPLINEN